MKERRKKRSARSQRSAPVDVPTREPGSEGGNDEDAAGPALPENIRNLVSQLASDDTETREIAAGSLAHMCQNRQALKLITEVAPQLIGMLGDEAAIGVQNEVAGALRNISLVGTEATNDFLITTGIIPRLATLLKKVVSGLNQGCMSEQEGELAIKCLTHCLYLLWNLVEAGSGALAAANECQVLSVVMDVLQPSKFPLPTRVVAAECLQTLTEENDDASAAYIRSNAAAVPALSSLAVQPASLDSSDETLLTASIVGVLANLHSIAGDEVYPPIFEGLVNVLKTNAGDLLPDYARLLLEGDQDVATTKKQTDRLSGLFRAQQNALEVLTNMCSGSGGSDGQWMDQDDDDEEIDDFDDAVMLDNDGEEVANDIPPAVLHLITSSDIPQMVLQKCSSLNRGLYQILNGNTHGIAVVNLFSTLQMRSLSCLSNLIFALDLTQMGEAFCKELWSKFFAVGSAIPPGKESEFIEATTASMWAVLRVVPPDEVPSVLQATDEHVEQLCKISQLSLEETPVVQIAAILGLLGQTKVSTWMEPIGTVLLRLAITHASLWVVAEALNSIFDVYAEEDANAVVASLSMMEHLTKLLPVLKSKVKASKRKVDKDLYDRIDETKTNLARFIKYKKEQSI